MLNPAATQVLYMVEQKGKVATLVKTSGATYDPATRTVTGGTTSTQEVKAYASEYKLSDIDNENILRDDRRVLVASFATDGTPLVAPEVSDVLEGIGEANRVMEVQTILEGSAVACYICRTRK